MNQSLTDSYLWIFLNSGLASENLLAPLSLLLLFMGRMLPIIALAPFFGARVLPHPVKAVFAIALFVIFLPHLISVTTTPLDFNFKLLLLFVKEIFIGFIIGMLISIPFTIVQTTGMFIDHQRGGASLMVNDPSIQNQSSPLGMLFNLVLIFLFFMIDGPFLFIEGIFHSYELVPPDQFINPAFFEHTSSFFEFLIPLLNVTMKTATKLAVPALLAILMTDFFLGVANRLAPQVQITFLGLPLKSLLGLAVICLGWNIFAKQMTIEAYAWLKEIERVLPMFKPAGT